MAAIRLLRDTIETCRRDARETFLAPVKRAMKPYLHTLFPGAETEIDEHFLIGGVQRSGPEFEPFASLSDGTREQIARAQEERARTRKVMGVPEHRFLVGWIGRMTGVKRGADVLRAFRLLRDHGVDATLCMVGDGPEREQLEELANELHLMHDCLFAGYQDGVLRAMIQISD